MKKQYMRKLLFSIAFLCAMFSNAQTATENQSVTENDLNVVLQSIVGKLEKLKGVQEDVSLIGEATGIIPFVNGHEYIDLGLSVKWATMNVGATEVAGAKKNSKTGELDCYGDYYAWGETTAYREVPNALYSSYLDGSGIWNSGYLTLVTNNTAKTDYSWSTYKWGTSESSSSQLKYKSSSYATLELNDDAARINWGGTWRIPTTTEQQELTNNCFWKWTTNYNNSGVTGYIVYKVKDDSDKGKHPYYDGSYNNPVPTASYTLSDTHIFLPASGVCKGSSFDYVGSFGSYWSSSLYTSQSYNAYGLGFDLVDVGRNYGSRCYGQTVRAVCP